jgi:hypothetical protein
MLNGRAKRKNSVLICLGFKVYEMDWACAKGRSGLSGISIRER